jgi:hypothetical protein
MNGLGRVLELFFEADVLARWSRGDVKVRSRGDVKVKSREDVKARS